jgi:ABC-type uncharacterized transport system substrate-binding protein
VIAALDGPAALAAKAATTTIPIVFNTGIDPVAVGLVVSLQRPGGNLTGVNMIAGPLPAKQFGLLHEVIPAAGIIALQVNPTNANAERDAAIVQFKSTRTSTRLLSSSAPSRLRNACKKKPCVMRLGRALVHQLLFQQYRPISDISGAG